MNKKIRGNIVGIPNPNLIEELKGEMYEVETDLMYTKEDVGYISEILKNLEKLFATKEEVDGIKTYVDEQIGEALEGDY